jgi:hypothetical protein
MTSEYFGTVTREKETAASGRTKQKIMVFLVHKIFQIAKGKRLVLV